MGNGLRLRLGQEQRRGTIFVSEWITSRIYIYTMIMNPNTFRINQRSEPPEIIGSTRQKICEAAIE